MVNRTMSSKLVRKETRERLKKFLSRVSKKDRENLAIARLQFPGGEWVRRQPEEFQPKFDYDYFQYLKKIAFAEQNIKVLEKDYPEDFVTYQKDLDYDSKHDKKSKVKRGKVKRVK